ncbi:MAG: hypothetical protein GQ534_01880 [Candidatus Delongbacteria bacterium]|nr:hypothetical protein [Candidatus Delongbacteria bacterium]
MHKKLIFVISLIFVLSLVAQTSSGTGPTSSSDSSIKEQATGIKHTLVEDPIEIEIQKRVEAEVEKRMNEEFQKRVDKEVKKRVDAEVKKRITAKKPKKAKKKIKKVIKKKNNFSSFKEIQYAEELYNNGKKTKARSVLDVLKNDKDKKMAEEAHYLLIKQDNNLFIPNIKRSRNYNKVIDYNNNTKEFDKFKRSFPKSKYTKDIKSMMKNRVKTFNTINDRRNMNLVDLKDSCTIEYKGDSTYICTFKKTFKDKNKKKHRLEINISGKITKYDPSGDMQDEWDTSGLLIDDNALIEVTLDGDSKIKYKNPIVHKQNPEYELRRVVEYGFSQNKTCVKEHKVENMINLASYLGDKFVVSNLEIKTHFGRMNELASMDIIYAAKPNGNFFSDRFKSKCYIEFALDER